MIPDDLQEFVREMSEIEDNRKQRFAEIRNAIITAEVNHEYLIFLLNRLRSSIDFLCIEARTKTLFLKRRGYKEEYELWLKDLVNRSLALEKSLNITRLTPESN